MSYRILPVWLLLLFLQTARAQQSGFPKDSLLGIALKARPDTNSLNAFMEITRHFYNTAEYDSSLKYTLLAIPPARKVNNPKKLGRIIYNAGMAYNSLTRYDSARYYFDEGEKIAIQNKDTALQLYTINGNALLFNYLSDFATAAEYLTRAARLIEGSTNPQFTVFLPQTYGNLGHNLIAENQIEKGIAYEKKALALKNYPDESRYRVMIHLDIADAYLKLKDMEKARLHLDSATLINMPLKNIHVTGLIYNTKGAFYNATGDIAASVSAYEAAYRIADSTQNFYFKSEVGENLARQYLALQQKDKAALIAKESNQIALELKNHKVASGTYGILKEIAYHRNDFREALRFAELNKQYADSASNQETQKSILNLEARYQLEKKETEIAKLNLKNISNEIQLVKRNRWLLIGGISGAALLLILLALYRNTKQKQIIAEKDKKIQQEEIRFLERQQQVVSLQSMINGQETERTRIAKDLHDGLGGLFSTIKMHFSTLQHEESTLKTNPLFTKSYEMVNTASEEVRRIAHNMMPEVLIKIGLVQATQELCNSISAGKLLQVSLQTYGMNQRLNPSTEVMLFRIIQELLNNIIKHAQATEALIQFNLEQNRLSVVVEDNGKGFNLADQGNGKHAGLSSVESRVHYLNGKLSIDSQKEIGTTIMMDFLINS